MIEGTYQFFFCGVLINLQELCYIFLTEWPKCVDPLSGEVYNKGAIWSLSECAHCLCGDLQTGNCSSVSCPRPQCDDSFKMKGRCCFVCPVDYARGWLCCGLDCWTKRKKITENVICFLFVVFSLPL